MRPTREEIMRRSQQIKRNTVRTVRNTLIFIALLAIVWYVYLICEDSRERNRIVLPQQPTAALESGEKGANSQPIDQQKKEKTQEKNTDSDSRIKSDNGNDPGSASRSQQPSSSQN